MAEIFISTSTKDKNSGYVDSFIRKLQDTESSNEFFLVSDRGKGSEPGEDFNKYIKEKIKSTDGALLLISKAALKSKTILEVEYPEIFRQKKLRGDKYKIYPILIEDCDYLNIQEFDGLELINSPGTALSDVRTRSGAEYEFYIDQTIEKINRDYKSRTKKEVTIFGLAIFLIASLSFLMNRNAIDEEANNQLEEINEKLDELVVASENEFNDIFTELTEGDCFNYKGGVKAYALEPYLINNLTDETYDPTFISLAIENGYSDIPIKILECSELHDFEVTYSSNAKPQHNANENGQIVVQEISEAKDFINFCTSETVKYVGEKVQNALQPINNLISYQIYNENDEYKFICAKFNYTANNYIHQRATESIKDYTKLHPLSTGEFTFSTIGVGECLTSYPYGWNNMTEYQRFSSLVEVTDCSNTHTHEVFYEFEVSITDNAAIFPGSSLPFDVKNHDESPAISEFIFTEETGYEDNYLNNRILKLIYSPETINATIYNKDFFNVFLTFIQPGSEVYFEASPLSGEEEGEGISVFKVTSQENRTSKVGSEALLKSEEICQNIHNYAFKNLEVYKNQYSKSEWKTQAFLSSDPRNINEDGLVEVKCISYLSPEGGVLEVTRDLTFQRTLLNSKGSLVDSFNNKYGQPITNLSYLYKDRPIIRDKNYIIKDIFDLEIGDCWDIKFLYEYSNYLEKTWSERWLIPITDCSYSHSNEIIHTIDDGELTTLLNTEGKMFYAGGTYDDYCFWEVMYYDLQGSRIVTEGLLEVGGVTEVTTSMRYQQVLEKDGQKKHICYFWKKDLEKEGNVALKINESVFEKFEPTEFALTTISCPDEVVVGKLTEILVEYTRGDSEIEKWEYIEVYTDGETSISDTSTTDISPEDTDVFNKLNERYKGVKPVGVEPKTTEDLTNITEGYFTVYAEDESGNKADTTCKFDVVEER